jgi:uncharacterized protein YgbK (DUF1537 family)
VTELDPAPPGVLDPWAVDPAVIADAVRASGRTLIVLDDDPTGTQSVQHLPVLTAWSVGDLEWALEQDAPAVYVLTNTRSLDARSAAARTREVVIAASTAATRLGRRIEFISRSDSTLRGHFPLETDTIAEALAELGHARPHGVLIVPAFPDAGRVTIDSTHLVRTGEQLVPVGETEFARDATFGYRSSELGDWVAEKTDGRWASADVLRIVLPVIRSGPDAVVAVLQTATGGRPIVADAVVEDDLRVLALALEQCASAGFEFIARVGPPFVRARIGQPVAVPLTADDLRATAPTGRRGGGLIVVGSHVGVTSRQLERLRAGQPGIRTVELSVPSIIAADTRDAHVAAIADEVVDALTAGDVIVHTSRTVVTSDGGEASLAISREVSAAVCEVVRRALAAHPPAFVIAKGGITSSDVATEGLGIRRAIVRGPMLPGIVSLWESVDGPAAGIPYVVFAGNVGDDDSLLQVVTTFINARRANATRS